MTSTKNQLLGVIAAPMLTTEQLADALSLQPQTLRKRYCQTGSYFSVKPTKLPNGLLRWPANALQELLQRGGSQ